MGSAPIKWTCTASLDFSDQDSWLTGPYWPLGRRRKKKICHSSSSNVVNSVWMLALTFALPSAFPVKVHPTGALLFTPHHSQLTLLQHIIIQSPYLKQPVHFLSDIPKYWIEDDGTMCLDESHRWKSADTIAWLRTRGLQSVPNSIKADIGDLVYNGPKSNARDESAAPWAVCMRSSIQRSATWTMNLLPMSRRLNRESEPMSHWECPCEARGYLASGPTSFLPLLLILWGSMSDTVNDLSDRTDCCGSECKLFHLVSCFFNSSRVSAVDSCIPFWLMLEPLHEYVYESLYFIWLELFSRHFYVR